MHYLELTADDIYSAMIRCPDSVGDTIDKGKGWNVTADLHRQRAQLRHLAASLNVILAENQDLLSEKLREDEEQDLAREAAS